jgi:bacterioferritin-associated ferredoxin
MVVCHCEAVNDAAIRAAVASGGAPVDELTIDDIVARCGAGGHCGGCHDTIRSILERLSTETRETSLGGIRSHRLLSRA